MTNVVAAVTAPTCHRLGAFLLILFLQSNPAMAQSEEIRRAVDTCSNYQNSVKLSENRTILCFDGPIRPDPQVDDQFQHLNDHGFFVVRSPGGYAWVAMKMADVLLEKDATVIIRDYCLSACANYIFVATSKTYVLKNSIVAWHGGPSDAHCDGYLDGDRSALGTNHEIFCKNLALQVIFFRKREIKPSFIYGPPTAYTKMMFDILRTPQGRSKTLTPGLTSKIFWMWNPKSYGEKMQARIIYEKYPNGQDDVDEIIRRSGLGTQVIYDPQL